MPPSAAACCSGHRATSPAEPRAQSDGAATLPSVTGTDWHAWHADYADPTSPLSRRRRIVQRHVRSFLDGLDGSAGRVVSMCAGDGRDVLDVLAQHPARAGVDVTLVEYDEGLAESARAFAAAAGLPKVDVRCRDAGRTDAYVGAVPAGLVLACGVFGNIVDDDVRTTVAALPQLCAEGATVVWTRGRWGEDLTPQVRQWFAECGFAELAFDAPDDVLFSVGAHRLAAEPRPLRPGERLFTFVR